MKLLRCLRALFAAALLAAGPASAQVVTPPGGRTGLEPPANFVAATAFSGFENRAIGSRIVINELPAEAFANVRESFVGANAKSALATRGVQLMGVETLQTPVAQTILVRAEQTVGNAVVDMFILAFPGPGYTGIVTLSRPQVSTGQLPDAAVRKSMLSVRASAAPIGDPVAALPFTFTEGPRLKVAQTMGGNSVMFDDKAVAQGKPRPQFIISRGPDERPASERGERNAYAFRLLSSLQNFRNVAIVRQGATTIAGLEGVEIEATALHAGTNETGTVLQIVLFEANGYYRLLSFVPNSLRETYLPEIRTMIASFKPKR